MEPFGAASSFAGLLSLGIEVSKGLLQYYRSWRSADNDIARTYASIDTLAKTLIMIQQVLEKNNFRAAHVQSVETSITAVQQGLNSLKKKLDKIRAVPKHDTWLEKSKAQFRRTLYPFKESTLVKLKELSQDARDDLNLALETLQIDSSADVLNKIIVLSDQLGDVFDSVEFLKDNIASISIDVKDMQSSSQSVSAELDTLISLETGDFEKKQQDILHQEARQDGILTWLLDTAEFRTWLQGPSPATLWCTGIRGSGKTVLAALVIDHLQQQVLPQKGVGLAYVYCNYKEKDKHSGMHLIANIIQQLIAQRPGLIRTEVEPIYQKRKATKSYPELEELSSVLDALCVQYFTKIYVVIDALDEYTEENDARRTLLRECQRAHHCIHLMVTSRHIPAISRQLSNPIRLEVQAKDQDIMNYVEERISTSERLNLLVPKEAELKESMKRSITEKASGMFLLARLHLDLLATKTTFRRLKTALSSLPRALDDSYDEAMKRLQEQNDDEYQLARKVLYWIISAAMPLNLRMLQHALAVETLEDTCLDHENIPPAELIISVCAGMVVMQPDSGIVELVHYTAQEYLERKALKYFPEAHEQVLQACITYLSFDEFRKGACDFGERLHQRVDDYPLLPYASRYWGLHINEGSCEEQNQKLILSFIREQNIVRSFTQVESWIQTPWLRNVPYRNPLHVASYYGLQNTVRILLDEGMVPTAALDSLGQTALHETRDEKIAAMLLKHGAEVDCTDIYDRTPLMFSARRGDEAVMSVLLQSGANIELDDEFGNNALQEATQNSHEGASRLLLDAGLDPNTRNPVNGYSSLHMAARNGDQTLVILLLSYGADLTMQDCDGRSPIQSAALLGHKKITQLLLDSVAKVHPQENFEAIVEKEGIVVRTLMGYAKLDELDAQGRSALMLTCQGTWRYVVQLLEEGADPRMIDLQGRTCLHHAAATGSSMTVKSLLNAGFDPNFADKDGWTSLHWAAKGYQNANVQVLLEGGADPMLKTKDEWTMSKIALYHHQVAVLAHLQQAGVSELASVFHEAQNQLSEWLLANIPNTFKCTETFTQSFLDHKLRKAICDGCDLDIYGARFRCKVCLDFDFCFKCISTATESHPDHEFCCL